MGGIGVALMVTALVLLFPTPGSSATPWPTTEWQVYCYRPTCEQWYGDSAPCAERSTSIEWEGYDYEVIGATEGWDGSQECPSGGPVGTHVAQLLHKASEWLQSHGFEPPLLPRPEVKYIAFVTHPFLAVSVYGAQPPKDANGNRVPQPFYVSPQPGLEDPQFRTLILLGPDPKDIAHELFHAVQYNSPAWGGGYGSVTAWIEEGTAEAVGVAFAGSNERGNRPYDEILHWNASPGQAYEDQYFWRQVGRQIGSADDISYLQRLLGKAALEGPRGLKSVDAVVKEPGKGLYEELPTFFTGLDVDRGDFGSADQIEIRMPADKKRHEKEFAGRAEEVAGSAHKLRVRRSSSQAAKQLEVEISFKEDHEDLHLIVDGHRYDRGFGPRNLYRDLIIQGDNRKYDVVAANIAPEAVKSRDRKYDLKVQLREVNWCSMTASVTGDIGGSYFGDVAHFSTKGGATIYGAFSNPEMVEGVADWLANMAERAGGEEAGDEMRAQKEEWLNEIEEIPQETFGLSLSEQKLDADDAENLAFIVGGFTLQASVIGPEVGEGVTGKIPLKMLRVVPGPRAESTLDQVPFVWAEGAPGSAQLFITRNTGDLVAGRIAGTLYAEGYHKPDGSKPVIVVQASFVALEGPYGCMPGAAGLSF